MSGSLADRLGGGRRRHVVGRAGEIDMFRAALAQPDDAFRVLFLHGPGGVGKSTLLAVLADIAQADGAMPLRLDARTLVPMPESVGRAVAAAADAADLPAAEAVARLDRPVLLIDTAEMLASLEDWLRGDFLPGLPQEALVVLAGRVPPSPRWTADPAWRDVLRVVSLRNLPPRDARAYLRSASVPGGLHDRLVALSHGHPLTLTLLVDAIGPDAAAVPASLTDVPELVGTLLAQVVDAAPTSRHRAALEVAAHAASTTEGLLRHVLGERDAADLFAWLRGLSFVEAGQHGLSLHDIVRDVLDADLRWRDPSRYARVHRGVRGYLMAGIEAAGGDSGVEVQRRIADAIWVSRHHPALSRYLDGGSGSGAYIDEFTAGDRSDLVAMTVRHQGAEQGRLLEHWLDRQPHAFRVFRHRDGAVAGFGGNLDLHAATAEDIERDPGARAMWRYAQEHGPPRPGEQVTAWRFFIDREHHHDPSVSLSLTTVWLVLDVLSRRRRSWDFIGTYTDAATWQPAMDYAGYGRAEAADYLVGNRRYTVFAQDWRRTSVADWLERTAAQELREATTPPHAHDADLVLSQTEFAEAVRAALRNLHDADALARSPLLRSRLARGRGGGTRALRALLDDAAGALRADPRAADLFEVLDRTFLHPAPTQERAAELLHLSFSTYRRRRDRAVARVVDRLWHDEVYGAAGDTGGRAAEDEQRMDSERPGS